MGKQELKLVLASRMDNLNLLSNAIRGICQNIAKEETLIYQLVLCVFEAVTNAIVHAYHRQPNHWVEVLVTLDESSLTFEVLDSGEAAFLPEFKKELDYNPEEVLTCPESGMGLFLIRSFMDTLSYSQNAEGKNVLKMVKNLKKTG